MMGLFSPGARTFSRARRKGPCGRSGWPRKDLIRVRRRGFSRILTSGIRNELSKGLKLNTCRVSQRSRRSEKEKKNGRGKEGI